MHVTTRKSVSVPNCCAIRSWASWLDDRKTGYHMSILIMTYCGASITVWMLRAIGSYTVRWADRSSDRKKAATVPDHCRPWPHG